jgi:hypothetical protein
MLTLSIPVMLILYLLVVKELMGAIPGSHVGCLLDFEAIFGKKNWNFFSEEKNGQPISQWQKQKSFETII